MEKLFDPKWQTRFKQAHDWSRERLAPFRKNNEYIYRLLSGSRYGEFNLDKSTPVPFLKLLHQTLLRALVATNPRCMITSQVPHLKPVARAMEIAVNHRIRDAKLINALRSAVSNALVSIGILKVGVCYYPVEGATGLLHDYMKTYVDSISLDDWVHDMTARRFDQIGYCGHRLRMPREAMLNDPNLDPNRVKELPHAQRDVTDEQGNPSTSALGSGADPSHVGEHEDMIDLWEIWFPRDNVVALFPCHRGGVLMTGDPLWASPYVGPELGPYHYIRFGEIPDNTMPAPPVTEMADMHEAFNGTYRKFLKTALNSKRVIPVLGGNEEDAKRINATPDGHAVRVDAAAPPQEVLYGTQTQAHLMAIARMQSDCSYYSGGLESIAGLGPQSATVGQDKMLAEAASKGLQAMQEITVEATQDVMRSLAWYWHHEPRTYNVEVPVDGFPGESIPTQITPQDREGAWLDLNFTIDPYSLQNSTPQDQLGKLMNLTMNVLLPAAPLMQQQGLGLDWQEWLREVSHLSNLPALERILTFQTPPEREEMEEPPKMGPTPGGGTYEHVNRSETTQRGQNSAQMMAAMGAASPQQAGVAGMPQ